MDLKQLQSFVAVAEQASFTRAAQVLGVAQPALSRHIRSLEVELRQTLLMRNGRGAVTTDAGKLLLEHARGIIEQVARARHALGAPGAAARAGLGHGRPLPEVPSAHRVPPRSGLWRRAQRRAGLGGHAGRHHWRVQRGRGHF